MKATLTRHIPYSRREGVEHNVTNAGREYLAFLEVEVMDNHIAHQRRATMERLMAAFNARDLEALMDCMAEECAFYGAAGPDAEGTRHSGRAAVLAAYAAIFDSFPQAAWTEGQHSVAGDVGLSSWRFIGTDKAGKAVDVRGCDIFAFDGEKIALKDSYRKARG
jgi:ketosteroid isomerase-like protein